LLFLLLFCLDAFVACHCCLIARYLAALVVAPCWCALLHSLLHLVVLASHLVAFILVPCYFHCFVVHALMFVLPCFHYLTPFDALLLTPCCPTIVPCWLMGLATLPLCLVVLPCWLLGLATHHYYSPLKKYLLHPPMCHCCFVALLLYLVSWYSFPILLCKWRNLGQHQVSSNNKGFFFSRFLEFFFLCFVFFCFFVLFLFAIFFELNTFCFSVVCEFQYVVALFLCL
jgi:hypothetical protein